jgi:hypothetical protein
MLSTGALASTGISSEVSFGVKVATNMSSVQSAVVIQQTAGLGLPDILVDFNSSNITSLAQLRAAFADMLVRCAQVAGLT